MRIAVIGTGYVGLVTGACFSEFGVTVVCVDKDAAKINRLNAGEIPIYEPGLDRLVHTNMAANRLRFRTGLDRAVTRADAVFIAVGTPSRRGDGHADLRYVYDAARELAPHLRGYTVVVTKSTVPVGTGREVARIIRETNPEADFDVVSNPEFLREGSAIHDFMRPDRVMIGADSERLFAAVAAFAEETGEPVTLIGVSLGGIMARLVAHRHPELVREVITVASPYAGDPRATNVWRLFELLTGDKIDSAAVVAQRLEIAAPLSMAATAIWSSPSE